MPEFHELLKGYRRFRENGYPRQRARYDQLVDEGQSPKLMVIGCSDSRVDPAQIFDVDPGEIFVVRNVAALVPPFETTPGLHGVSAAVEFAVQVLEVRQIIVMGHGHCGGCKAALSQSVKGKAHGDGGFVADWIEQLSGVRESVADAFGTESREAERAMELAAVGVSIANLLTFPFVAERVSKGALKIRGTFFAISEGVLYLRDEDSGTFAAVS